MNKMLIWAAIAVVIVGGTYLLITNLGTFSTADDAEQMMEEDDSITNDDTPSQEDFSGGMEEKGSYEVYAPEKLALANEGKAVLYFHADWCPICRQIEGEIHSSPARIPSGVHILKVDYDTATALRQKYGVTYQHTFVQVNAEGGMIAKWGDAMTLVQVLAKIK